MSDFLNLLSKTADKYKIILEQGPLPGDTGENDEIEENDPATPETNPPIDAGNQEMDPNLNPPAESALPQVDTQANQSMLSSRDLMFVKLIYKALTIDLDPSQYTDLLEITDINQNNAKQILNKLETIINNF